MARRELRSAARRARLTLTLTQTLTLTLSLTLTLILILALTLTLTSRAGPRCTDEVHEHHRRLRRAPERGRGAPRTLGSVGRDPGRGAIGLGAEEPRRGLHQPLTHASVREPPLAHDVACGVARVVGAQRRGHVAHALG